MTHDLDLNSAAATFDVPPGDVDAVIRRAAQRTTRRRQFIAMAAVMGLIGATAGVARLTSGGGGPLVVADGGGAPVHGDAGVTWRRVSVRSGLAGGRAPRSTPLYALSTAAAEHDPQTAAQRKTVWRSDDGIEWQTVSRLSDDLYLTDLSERGSRIYAVGTAPGQSMVRGHPATTVVVGWSDDGAKSWSRAALPIDTAAIAAVSLYDGPSVQPSMATGPKGTVAVVVVHVELDVPKLLPAGTSAPNGWAVTASGVDVLGPRHATPCPAGSTVAHPDSKSKQPGGDAPRNVTGIDCLRSDGTAFAVPAQEAYDVVRSFTFAELGVRGDVLSAVLGKPMAFTAPPGSTSFSRVDLPGFSEVASVLVNADDDGFDLALTTSHQTGEVMTGDVGLLHSVDGKQWTTQGRANGRQQWATAMGALGSTTAVLASGPSGGVLIRSDGGSGLRSHALADFIDPGVVNGGTVHLAAAGIGAFGAAAVVMIEPPRLKGQMESEKPNAMRLLTSRDGVTWQDQPLSDLAGGRVRDVLRVVVSADQAVVVVGVVNEDKPSGPSRQVALVGTAD